MIVPKFRIPETFDKYEREEAFYDNFSIEDDLYSDEDEVDFEDGYDVLDDFDDELDLGECEQ